MRKCNFISAHKKYGLPPADLTEIHKYSTLARTDLLHLIPPTSDNKCGNKGKNLKNAFTTVKKAQNSLGRLSRNSSPPPKIVARSMYRNLFKSEAQCTNFGQTFVWKLTQRRAFANPIITKFVTRRRLLCQVLRNTDENCGPRRRTLHLRPSVKYGLRCAYLQKFTITRWYYITISYTKFHKNTSRRRVQMKCDGTR